MAGIVRTVHMQSNIAWGPVDKFAPDLGIRGPEVGGEPSVPPALALIDPDGEAHVYVFSEDGRQELIRQLTGGVILPS